MRKHLRIRDVFSFFNDSTGERCGGLPTGSSHPAGFILSKKKKRRKKKKKRKKEKKEKKKRKKSVMRF
jgi:hypothetical protein